MELPPVMCPQCGHSYNHPGRTGKTTCRECGATITVAMPQAAPEAPRTGPPRVGLGAGRPAQPIVPRRPPSPVVRGGPHGEEGAHLHGPGKQQLSPAMIGGLLGGLLLIIVLVILVIQTNKDDAVPTPGANQPGTTAGTGSQRSREDGDLTALVEETIGAGSAQVPSGTGPTPTTEPDTPKKPGVPDRPRPAPAVVETGTLEAFGLVAGTDTEAEQQIRKLLAKAIDLEAGAAANRAAFALAKKGHLAVPIVINAMIELDPAQDEGRMQGTILNQVLKDITLEDHWWDPTPGEEGIRINKGTTRTWHRWWSQHKDTWTGPPEEE